VRACDVFFRAGFRRAGWPAHGSTSPAAPTERSQSTGMPSRRPSNGPPGARRAAVSPSGTRFAAPEAAGDRSLKAAFGQAAGEDPRRPRVSGLAGRNKPVEAPRFLRPGASPPGKPPPNTKRYIVMKRRRRYSPSSPPHLPPRLGSGACVSIADLAPTAVALQQGARDRHPVRRTANETRPRIFSRELDACSRARAP